MAQSAATRLDVFSVCVWSCSCCLRCNGCHRAELEGQLQNKDIFHEDWYAHLAYNMESSELVDDGYKSDRCAVSSREVARFRCTDCSCIANKPGQVSTKAGSLSSKLPALVAGWMLLSAQKTSRWR